MSPGAWAGPASAGRELDVDAAPRTVRVAATRIAEGDAISIDGSTGEVFLGEVPVASPVEDDIEGGLAAALAGVDAETAALVRSVDRLLTHADETRRPAVRANADTAQDAPRARSFGAQGIGLCRTEHMFLGDLRVLIERLVPAETADERQADFDTLLPLQRADFTALLDEMNGLPVNIRLLDPPLHEFLPDRTDLAVRVALHEVGLDYVSCSPFRVPVARLEAGRAAVMA